MAFSFRRSRLMSIVALCIVCIVYYLSSNSGAWPHGQPSKARPFFQAPIDGKVHWTKLKETFPVDSIRALPVGTPIDIPRIQAAAQSEPDDLKEVRLRRLAAVKESFQHSWQGYKDHAWLRDEVVPISGGYRDTFGGWAATLVDALDTLWIMGMKNDFEMAVAAISEIDFTTTETRHVNVFETTIRYMGGFLAAYDVSGGQYEVLLVKAKEVGDLLMSVFDTPNRMPISRWDWQAYVKGNPQTAPPQTLVSELGSLSLEFTRLSQLTGDNKYYDAVQRIGDVFEQSQNSTKLPGMWPVMIDAATPAFDRDTSFTLGGMSDSLYEYLPKQYLMLGGLLAQPRSMYEQFIKVAKEHMFFRVLNPNNTAIMVSGDVHAPATSIRVDAKGQHLTCFAGGMVAIASKIFNRESELSLAAQLTEGCVWAYDSHPLGIAPEIYSVVRCSSDEECKWTDQKWYSAVTLPPKPLSPGETPPESYTSQVLAAIAERRLSPGFVYYDDRKYILRPEAIESVFIMYRATGDREWQEKAWRMFTAIEKQTRTSIASSAIDDVTNQHPQQLDSMESFWLAETLKYFYLIFSEMDLVSLDDFVLNTEAHPLKRMDGKVKMVNHGVSM